jgi:hypothetical protein
VLLGDADRELLYEKLKVHAAYGRLGIEELERRVAAVAMAQTSEEAARVMADLPPLAADEPRGRLRARGGFARLAADRRALSRPELEQRDARVG